MYLCSFPNIVKLTAVVPVPHTRWEEEEEGEGVAVVTSTSGVWRSCLAVPARLIWMWNRTILISQKSFPSYVHHVKMQLSLASVVPSQALVQAPPHHPSTAFIGERGREREKLFI